MLKVLILIFTILNIYAQDISQFLVKHKAEDSFITKYEYGKMLYKNPRGISCAKCHGENAKGKVISKFVHIRRKIKYNCIVKSDDMTSISKKQFIRKLDPTKKPIRKRFDKTQICEKLIYGNTMPKYFLTNAEMDSIYYYITHIRKNDE